MSNSDPWTGVSSDVIGRFLDVQITKRSFARRTRAAYRIDLQRLDRWMQQTVQRTAITADVTDLRRYFSKYLPAGCSSWTVKRARSSARRFYAFLRDCHYRDDDPMACLTGASLSPDIEPLVERRLEAAA